MTTATRWIRLAVALAAATAALAPHPVHAGSADADALFEEGKRLMARKQWAQACEKFEASERSDPATGTELNLGRCREKNGQLASAWAAYKKAAATAKRRGDKVRENEARTHAADIKPQLLYLTIVVPDDARIDGLAIQRNATLVDPAAWNQPVPVDPDQYTISAEAPGYKPWSKSVGVKTVSTKVVVPRLDKLPEAPPAEPRRELRTAAVEPDAPAGGRDREVGGAEAGSAPSRWTGKRKLSLVLAAVGVAASGAGIGLGLHAGTLERNADRLCAQSVCNNPDGVNLNRSARSYAHAANIGYAAGGVAVVGAAALWLLGAPASRETIAIFPTLDATRVGLSFARSF